jgi:hypothetical protein
MNEKELRDLDARIAENVFGMRFEAIPKRANEKQFHGCFVNHYSKAMGKAVKYPQGICIGSFESVRLPEKAIAQYAPHYTTDRAAAMEVLERCAQKTGTVVWFDAQKGEWVVYNATIGMQVAAKTLPLAICKFAQLLFSKG